MYEFILIKRKDKTMYEARDSVYCYPGTNTLVNKLNIKDANKLDNYEKSMVALKLMALEKKELLAISILLILLEFINFFLRIFTLLLDYLEAKILQKAIFNLLNGNILIVN